MTEAIDRIYGTTEKFTELRDWIIKNKPEAIKFLYYGEDIEFRKVWLGDWNNGLEHPMTYFPERIDKFMFENCPFAYVRDKIKLQYGDSVDWIEYKENNIYENSNVQTKRGRPKKRV